MRHTENRLALTLAAVSLAACPVWISLIHSATAMGLSGEFLCSVLLMGLQSLCLLRIGRGETPDGALLLIVSLWSMLSGIVIPLAAVGYTLNHGGIDTVLSAVESIQPGDPLLQLTLGTLILLFSATQIVSGVFLWARSTESERAS